MGLAAPWHVESSGPGIEPMSPLQWQADSLPRSHQGSPAPAFLNLLNGSVGPCLPQPAPSPRSLCFCEDQRCTQTGQHPRDSLVFPVPLAQALDNSLVGSPPSPIAPFKSGSWWCVRDWVWRLTSWIPVPTQWLLTKGMYMCVCLCVSYLVFLWPVSSSIKGQKVPKSYELLLKLNVELKP